MSVKTKNAFLISDVWLADILRKPVYKLNVDRNVSKPVLENSLKELPSSVFVYTKVYTADVMLTTMLERLGFHLVDTNVVFKKAACNHAEFFGRCHLRFAKPQDEEEVVHLAQRAFVYSRFHLDLNIGKDTADEIKSQWAKNFFHQQRGDQMIVAVMDERIVGFMQLLYGKDKILTIDLIGVDENHRRQGIARDMISYSEMNCPGFEFIRAGTQVANAPSIALYEKMGFRLEYSQYVFHYHR